MGKAKKKKEAKVAKVDSKPRINHLTGLRFFAAFLVFMSHIEFSGSYDSLQIVFKQGFIGVSFFFILSGFVLSYSYKQRLVQKQISKLKVIGDVTCDVDGSVPTTIKSTTIEEPNFYLNTETFLEIDKTKSNLAIMAVDNLPSELPRDSSTEFGNGIVSEVIPYLLGEDDGRILNSTIAMEGRFLEKYNYLYDYINS